MKINNLFILTDLEGIAGVERFEQTRERGPEYLEAKEIFTKEMNVLIEAIKIYDPNIKIHFWDAHGSGSAIREKLSSVETYIPNGWINMSDFFKDHDIDALLFAGQHAMSNTINGNLAHTMSSKTVDYYKLNGYLVGEFGLRAAIAGELDVPTIYISGDDKACLEAKNLIPNIVTCEVKKGTGLETAESLPFDNVYSLIQEKIKLALEMWKEIKPYKINTPVTLEKRYKQNQYKKHIFLLFSRKLKALAKKNAKILDSRTILWSAETLVELERIKAL